MPFGRFGSGGQRGGEVVKNTPFKIFVTPMGSSENFSCKTEQWPGWFALNAWRIQAFREETNGRVESALFCNSIGRIPLASGLEK